MIKGDEKTGWWIACPTCGERLTGFYKERIKAKKALRDGYEVHCAPCASAKYFPQPVEEDDE